VIEILEESRMTLKQVLSDCPDIVQEYAIIVVVDGQPSASAIDEIQALELVGGILIIK
jgi:hypothetical protein